MRIIFLLLFLFAGCLPSKPGPNLESSQSGVGPTPTPTPTPTTASADLLKLAIVPNQVVDSTSFEVQALAENYDPTIPVTTPIIKVNGGASLEMAVTMLKWPGTNTNSVSVWSKNVTLAADQANSIEISSGTTTLTFQITHRSTLTINTATSGADLVTKMRSAIANDSVNIIELAYNEADLGATIDTIGDGYANNRTTWMTIRPATGYSITWDRGSHLTFRRPKMSWIHLQDVVFGSDTSDGGSGEWYVEPNHRVWIDHCEFRGKYKNSWPKATKLTATWSTDIRSQASEGQKLYYTNTLWDGTAAVAATSHVELARDLTFTTIRGDFNNFGKVFLNGIGHDIFNIRNFPDTDYFHNDIFQVWGNSGTTDIIFKGLRIESPTIPASIQPFLFDRTLVPDYQRIILDTIEIYGAEENSVLRAQLAGQMNNARISNIKINDQSLTIRCDFVEPQGAFDPTNMFLHNVQTKSVLYSDAIGGDANYTYSNVQDTDDISLELSLLANLPGVTWSQIAVAPMPTVGTFSSYQAGNPRYRTDSGGGIMINTLSLTGLASVSAYDQGSAFGLFFTFDTQANKDAHLASIQGIRLIVTVKTQGDGGAAGTIYTYEWASPTTGTSGSFTAVTSLLKYADLAIGSSSWPLAGENLWGNAPDYKLEYY